LAKSEWSFKTAVECSAALAAKQVSAVELAQDAIGRIEPMMQRSTRSAFAISNAAWKRHARDAALGRGETKSLLGLP